MKIIVIPAKFGSTRLPEKNFIPFYEGLNLTELAIIKAVKTSASLVIVSTESLIKLEELSIFCKHRKLQGVSLHLRNRKLASDPATIVDVVNDALDAIIKGPFVEDIDVAVMLPTTPLTTTLNIEEAFNLLAANPCSRVLSVSKNAKPPFNSWSVKAETESKLEATFPNSPYRSVQSTRCPVTYMSNGAVSAWRMTGGTINTNCENIALFMEQRQSIDIDDIFEFELAQLLFEKEKICLT